MADTLQFFLTFFHAIDEILNSLPLARFNQLDELIWNQLHDLFEYNQFPVVDRAEIGQLPLASQHVFILPVQILFLADQKLFHK